MTNQEYTSFIGGKIFFPLSISLFKNRFKSKKSLVTISFFNSFNQLSCKVSISNFKRSFCSSVSVLTQASLSNLIAGREAVASVEVEPDVPLELVAVTVVFAEEAAAF